MHLYVTLHGWEQCSNIALHHTHTSYVCNNATYNIAPPHRISYIHVAIQTFTRSIVSSQCIGVDVYSLRSNVVLAKGHNRRCLHASAMYVAVFTCGALCGAAVLCCAWAAGDMFEVCVIFAVGASCGVLVTMCRPSMCTCSRNKRNTKRKGKHDVKCWQIIATGSRKSHMKRDCYRLAGKTDGELNTYDMCGDCCGQ
jgi:hypothetical protein